MISSKIYNHCVIISKIRCNFCCNIENHLLLNKLNLFILLLQWRIFLVEVLYFYVLSILQNWFLLWIGNVHLFFLLRILIFSLSYQFIHLFDFHWNGFLIFIFSAFSEPLLTFIDNCWKFILIISFKQINIRVLAETKKIDDFIH